MSGQWIEMTPCPAFIDGHVIREGAFLSQPGAVIRVCECGKCPKNEPFQDVAVPPSKPEE